MLASYFQLVRLPNLLFLALTQFLMHQAVLMPILQLNGFDTHNISSTHLVLLIVATVFIAAGGNVLNDYFDIKIDAINKPEKQIVGKSISRQTAMILHQALTGIGVLTGLILAYMTKNFTLAFIFIVVPGLLWFYSSNYKRQFMVGNLVIAFTVGLSILTVPIMEMGMLKKEYGDLIYGTNIPQWFYLWISGFAVFAFLCTWIREIVKDIQDEKGDREMECRTMPIKWGTGKTKIFIYVLVAVTIALLLVVGKLIPFEGSFTLRYVIFGIIIPLLTFVYLTIKAKNRNDYQQASTLLKIIMLVGVSYSFIFYFLLAKTFGLKFFNLFLIQ